MKKIINLNHGCRWKWWRPFAIAADFIPPKAATRVIAAKKKKKNLEGNIKIQR